MREQLTLSVKEIELLKNEGQRKERGLRAEVQQLQNRLQQFERVGAHTCTNSTNSED